MARRVFIFLGISFVLSSLLLNLGCANYRLGTGAELAFKSIYVAPVESEALLPQARLLVASRVREAFLRDSRITLSNTPDQADAILHITLKRYTRDATVAKAEDAGLARKFSLTIQAECSLSLRNGKDLFTARKISAQREAYNDAGQLLSEYEALPYLADVLARNVTHATLDTW